MKVAIIGTGTMGITHANAIKASDKLSLSAFVGRDINKTRDISHEFPSNSYIDIEDMLLKEDIDIVDICLPTYLHEEAVAIAIKHKKHIMCEKPFTFSPNIANRLMEEAESAGVKMMVLQVVRFWPEYVYIKDLVDKKEIGKIKNVYINRLSTYPRYSNWFKDPKKSGGGLYDLGIHDLDYLYHVFGKVKSIYARGHKTSEGIYNGVSTSIVFESGTIATVEFNMDIIGNYPFTTSLRVFGDGGTVEYNSTWRYGNNLENTKVDELILYEKDKLPRNIRVDKYNPYQRQIEYFADCIKHGKEVDMMKMSDVVYVLKMIKSIEKSLATNSVVMI